MTGHVTKEMQRHYSTVGIDEKRAANDERCLVVHVRRKQLLAQLGGTRSGNASPVCGRTISAKEFKALLIEPNAFHGDWNYVIRPRAQER